jgi:ATP-dependent Clp endopeptidase proteolytic subunit ClpP
MRSWFQIRNAGSDSLTIDITDEIGYFGVSAKDFAAQLKAAGTPKSIVLNLDTPGGDCNDGFTIYDALKNSGASITVNITGMAASMGSVIMLAGEKIRIAENGRVMIHRVTGGAVGNADEMDAAAKVIQQFENRIVALYTERTGKDEAEIRDLMKAQMGTWFFGEEAIDAGFADELIKGTQARAFKAEWAAKFTMLPAALFDTRQDETPTASISTQITMTKAIIALAAHAGIALSGDETEDQICAAIAAHKPEAAKFEMNLEDAETKKIFDTAVGSGIAAALPAAVAAATQPLEEKIAALSALVTHGAAGSAQGAPATSGAGTAAKGSALDQFNAIEDPAERQAFYNKNMVAIKAAMKNAA